MHTRKDNVARTKDDFELGILKGKTVFPFNEPGQKQMTMNTKQGVVPYPIKYKGYTKGKLTDQGIAKPGDNFSVNGDTVVEEKLDDLTFSEAMKRANGKFNWRGREYQKGGNVKKQIGGYNDGPASYPSKTNDYPTLDAHTRSIINDGNNYSYDWKTYFVPGSNADYPIGMLRQTGGEVGYQNSLQNASNITSPFQRNPMFSTQGLASTDAQPVKLPLYTQGQTIKYRCGGTMKTGIVKEHDPKTGKIKLYK